MFKISIFSKTNFLVLEREAFPNIFPSVKSPNFPKINVFMLFLFVFGNSIGNVGETLLDKYSP